ncbi:MAG: hypothetical protein C4539_05495 [Ignavibacteriales bacterium]|nr:MAG: hypothetical protein C4539_05495 [Ignavibacteriales bacterium]
MTCRGFNSKKNAEKYCRNLHEK